MAVSYTHLEVYKRQEEYPEMDNENWLKWIIVKNVDGQMTLSTEDVPCLLYTSRCV